MRSAAEFVIAGNRNINNNACELYGWWLLASGGIDCLSAERLSSLCCSIKEENLLINRAEAVKRREIKKKPRLWWCSVQWSTCLQFRLKPRSGRGGSFCLLYHQPAVRRRWRRLFCDVGSFFFLPCLFFWDEEDLRVYMEGHSAGAALRLWRRWGLSRKPKRPRPVRVDR